MKQRPDCLYKINPRISFLRILGILFDYFIKNERDFMKHTSHALWRLLLGVFCLCLYSMAFSQTPNTLSATTQQLIDASSTIKSGARLTASQLTALNEAAKQRQQMLAEELSRPHPSLQYVLPKQIRDYLPRDTQLYIEKEVGPLTGKLIIRAASYETQHSEVIQYILIVGEKSYYLHFTDAPPTGLETDATLTIKEAIKIVEEFHGSHLILSKHAIVNVINPKYALPLSIGPQRTLTFLVNFSDKPNDRPWTPAQINELMYTEVTNQFMESSYGQTSLVGRVAGWYVLNVASTESCGTLINQVANLGDQAATADGIDLNQYDRKVYIFPETSVCGWGGLAQVGGAKTNAWINGAAYLHIVAHEVGHNLGLFHSNLLACPGSPNSGDCTREFYGDRTDLMGSGGVTHFNAFQKDRLGWLNYQTSPPITTVITSGTYRIDPFETNNQNPKALKILKRTDGSENYYLEFRQGIGFDAELAACGLTCDYTRGVIFHQGNSADPDSSNLLDMSPTDNSRSLVALLPGQSWMDPLAPNGGVTFEVISVASTGAIVKVTFVNNPPPMTPLINNVPIRNLAGRRGNEKYYYVQVPFGRSKLTVNISGGTGDADLYVRYNERPTLFKWQCRPFSYGNNETCTINAPEAGNYYIMVRAFANYSGVSLIASY
jgi:hypothetical protein